MKNQGAGFELQTQLFSKALTENIGELEMNRRMGTDVAVAVNELLDNFQTVVSQRKGNYGLLCRSLKQFISALSPYSEYNKYISRYLTYLNFLEREHQPEKTEKKSGKPGVLCMNLKTGMVYISK